MNQSMASRVEKAVIEGWFLDPPPLIAAMANGPTIGVTRAFVLQWTKFSRLFPRWVGSIMSNCPEFAVLAYEVENLMSEVVRDPESDGNHYQLLTRLGESVGLSQNEIETYPELPQSSDLFEWLWRKARNPDWLIGFAAVNGLEILGDRNLPLKYGVQSGTGLNPEPYADILGLEEENLEFFRVSDQADAGHGHETVEILARYTPAGREDEILAVLKEAMDQLRLMMNALWELATVIDAGLNSKARADGEG
ncbi:hypothetical protein EPN29_14190 [bacterium]|nr:MAG: hypothetical protein EPN29_14190 [bacterium]